MEFYFGFFWRLLMEPNVDLLKKFVNFMLVSSNAQIVEHQPEIEKRADTADISVLFLSGCANILAVYAQMS